MLMIGFLIMWMIFTFMVSDSEANPDVYYGNVVATEGKTIQVRAKGWQGIGILARTSDHDLIPELPLSATG